MHPINRKSIETEAPFLLIRVLPSTPSRFLLLLGTSARSRARIQGAINPPPGRVPRLLRQKSPEFRLPSSRRFFRERGCWGCCGITGVSVRLYVFLLLLVVWEGRRLARGSGTFRSTPQPETDKRKTAARRRRRGTPRRGLTRFPGPISPILSPLVRLNEVHRSPKTPQRTLFLSSYPRSPPPESSCTREGPAANA